MSPTSWRARDFLLLKSLPIAGNAKPSSTLGEWARVAVDREEGGEAETLIQSGAGTAIKRAFHGAEIIYVRWSARDGVKEPSEMG